MCSIEVWPVSPDNPNGSMGRTIELARGDLDEAMLIGRLVPRLQLLTDAPVRGPNTGDIELPAGNATRCNHVKCYCASACFFVWASGIDRFGDQLFIHQPYFDPSLFGNLPPEEAIKQHQQMIASARRYLREMDITDDVINLVAATPPASGTCPFEATSHGA